MVGTLHPTAGIHSVRLSKINIIFAPNKHARTLRLRGSRARGRPEKSGCEADLRPCGMMGAVRFPRRQEVQCKHAGEAGLAKASGALFINASLTLPATKKGRIASVQARRPWKRSVSDGCNRPRARHKAPHHRHCDQFRARREEASLRGTGELTRSAPSAAAGLFAVSIDLRCGPHCDERVHSVPLLLAVVL